MIVQRTFHLRSTIVHHFFYPDWIQNVERQSLWSSSKCDVWDFFQAVWPWNFIEQYIDGTPQSIPFAFCAHIMEWNIFWSFKRYVFYMAPVTIDLGWTKWIKSKWNIKIADGLHNN